MIIENVTVIDGIGAQPINGLDVTIRDGRFESLRPAAPRSEAGEAVVDGAGKFLLPGLWESHTHLRSSLGADEQGSLDEMLRQYVARGVTSVVDLGGPIKPFSTLRGRQRNSGPRGRARLLFAGPSFTGINGWPLSLHHNPALVHQIRGASDAGATVRTQLGQGTDVVKLIYDGETGSPEKLPYEALRTLVSTAHEASVRVLVHVHSFQDSIDALEAGADGLEHSFLPTPGREQAEADGLTEALLRTGAYLTPTLAAWEQIGRAGDQRYLTELLDEGYLSSADADAVLARQPRWGQLEFPHHPKAECLERLEAAFRFLPAMHRAGVKLVAGSDVALVLSRPAAALRELALLVRAGIPMKDVIVAASRHAAEKVGRGAAVGSIEAGKAADALLVDANPLDSLDALVRPGHLIATLRHGELVPVRP